MDRIESRMVAGFLAAAIGLSQVAVAMAADSGGKAAQAKAKSPAANAPLIARIVVTPSAKQIAKLRAEQRIVKRENGHAVGRQAAAGEVAATKAL